MADQGHPDHQLKRIVLPSGKTIEVVYFEHPAAAPPETSGAPAAPAVEPKVEERDLHICPDCNSSLVYPVQWEEADESHWHITLRCPNCERTEEGVFGQPQCDGFDDELERGTDALTRDYKRLMTANLSEEIDRFARALEVDGILPADF
ncbi:MAG: hypothetical protein QOC77_763 [Thermoleophilaceae bacterium]|jgi:hypothetical protein|nr:hypothetical protein [Thermoleophilaceae bacterium]MEA2470366.1 hypothetical protein [Thermoleophilaceae bacterium]